MRMSRTGSTRLEPQTTMRAAQYLRMSVAHQKVPTAYQADEIAKYAKEHGFSIVRTYQDDGKSGLQLKGMPALSQLIADVKNGNCDFETVLVYDVSRWGRFQDIDASAYYEFICKAAGITGRYCTE